MTEKFLHSAYLSIILWAPSTQIFPAISIPLYPLTRPFNYISGFNQIACLCCRKHKITPMHSKQALPHQFLCTEFPPFPWTHVFWAVRSCLKISVFQKQPCNLSNQPHRKIGTEDLISISCDPIQAQITPHTRPGSRHSVMRIVSLHRSLESAFLWKLS